MSVTEGIFPNSKWERQHLKDNYNHYHFPHIYIIACPILIGSTADRVALKRVLHTQGTHLRNMCFMIL